MATWTRRPQEQEGSNQFSVTFYVTQGVHSTLSTEEIFAIYLEIQVLVKEKGGLDYFQVYVNDVGDKLYFIDNCDPNQMTHGSFLKEHNYCTLLFANEY